MGIAVPPLVVDALEWVQWIFFAYFVGLNVVYLGLNYISAFSIHRHMRDRGAKFQPESFESYQPPISIIVPACNEEKSIVATVHSLLQLSYPEFEIVVVNDGSVDGTRDALIREFSLVEFPEAYRK